MPEQVTEAMATLMRSMDAIREQSGPDEPPAEVPEGTPRPKMLSLRPSAELDGALQWMTEYAIQAGIPPHRVTRSEIVRLCIRYGFINWASMVAQLPKWA